MKKVLLFMVMLAFVGYSFGQFSAKVRVGSVDVATVLPGSEIIVPVYLDELNANPGTIGGFDLFIMYDPAVITWKGSLLNPLPGVQNINPLFPYTAGEYTFNFNPVNNQLACIYTPGVGQDAVTAPQMLFEYKFTYNGGETALTWSYSKSIEGGIQTKGITTVFQNDLFINPYDVTTGVDGSVFIGSTGTPGLWTGMGASASWFDIGNWDDGVVPDQTIDVVIPAAAGIFPNPEIGLNMGVPAVALAASVVNDAVISIMADGYMTVVGAFTNNGSLSMYSNAVNSASFICEDAIEVPFQYNRYLDVTMALPAGERGWHYISSPVPGFTAGGNINDYYLNTFENGAWVYQQGLGFPSCTPPAVTNGVMEGWSVKLDENYAANLCAAINPETGMTVEFMGAPYFGPQTIALNPVAGYQLIGNPYPSYWDYEAFFPNPAGMTDAMYMWNEDANNYSAWIFGGPGTNGGSQFIPPAQGFFIQTTGTGGFLTFDPSEQVHVLGQPFYKDEVTSVVKLMASANGYTDEAIVRFSENSTINRDNNDAMKFKSPGTGVPALYTKADNLDISINGMPATASVPVYFECSLNGTYTIAAVETSDFENVVLEDLLTGEQTDLLVSGHTFNYTAGENTGRFILHFTPLGVNDISANSINIWAANQTIYVQAPATTGDIVVFNLMGQEVVRTAIEAGVNEIPMNESNTYYIVKVLGSEVTETGKVFIK